MYYIYIIKCQHGELYTGITTDISRRMKEHFFQTEKCAKFTKSHKVISLEALWQAQTRSYASKLEWKIKQLTKAQKIKLIDDNNVLYEFFPDIDSIQYTRIHDYNIDEMLICKTA